MKLNVAVQMDPIEHINITGDSTFALLLEAQKRGHGLSYYTPDKLSLRGEELVAPVQSLSVRDKHGAVVMKPLLGHGGAAVFRVMPQDMNFGSLFDMFSVTFREPWVIQRFLAEVKHGDKRIILVDGEFAGAVNRVPAPDDLRSNMVRGGTPKDTELTTREREICARIGPALRERGLIFVGIDVIDGNLTEINVTSPTGIRAIKTFGGPDVAAIIWNCIEAKRKGQNFSARV